MKKILVYCIVVFLVASFAASEMEFKKKTLKNFAKKYSIEQQEQCQEIQIANEVREHHSCDIYQNLTSCLNQSGIGTECSTTTVVKQDVCTEVSVETVTRNVCTPINKYTITKHKKNKDNTAELDFTDFGPCKQEQQGKCFVITCVSANDGAHNGEFTSCDGGQSCQQFEFCPKQIKKLVKNSKKQFSEQDEKFFLRSEKRVEVEQ